MSLPVWEHQCEGLQGNWRPSRLGLEEGTFNRAPEPSRLGLGADLLGFVS